MRSEVVPRGTSTPRQLGFAAPNMRPQVTEQVWRRRESWEQLDREDDLASSDELYDDGSSWVSPGRGLPPEAGARSTSRCDVCRREPCW
eukprot:COSAG02_NODE_23254_length_725_cov_0.538339_1_plen_88_part_01